MKGKTHMIIGAAAGAAAASYYSIETGIMLICSSIFGALVPDIDHPKSKINQKILPIKNKVFRMIVYLLLGATLIYVNAKSGIKGFRLLGCILIITSLSHHRGFTHSLLGFIFFSTAIYVLLNQYGFAGVYIGFSIGYFSHLIADFITNGGIELFYPWKKNMSFPITIKTGGIGENIVLIIASIYFVYKSFNSL